MEKKYSIKLKFKQPMLQVEHTLPSYLDISQTDILSNLGIDIQLEACLNKNVYCDQNGTFEKSFGIKTKNYTDLNLTPINLISDCKLIVDTDLFAFSLFDMEHLTGDSTHPYLNKKTLNQTYVSLIYLQLYFKANGKDCEISRKITVPEFYQTYLRNTIFQKSPITYSYNFPIINETTRSMTHREIFNRELDNLECKLEDLISYDFYTGNLVSIYRIPPKITRTLPKIDNTTTTLSEVGSGSTTLSEIASALPTIGATLQDIGSALPTIGATLQNIGSALPRVDLSLPTVGCDKHLDYTVLLLYNIINLIPDFRLTYVNLILEDYFSLEKALKYRKFLSNFIKLLETVKTNLNYEKFNYLSIICVKILQYRFRQIADGQELFNYLKEYVKTSQYVELYWSILLCPSNHFNEKETGQISLYHISIDNIYSNTKFQNFYYTMMVYLHTKYMQMSSQENGQMHKLLNHDKELEVYNYLDVVQYFSDLHEYVKQNYLSSHLKQRFQNLVKRYFLDANYIKIDRQGKILDSVI